LEAAFDLCKLFTDLNYRATSKDIDQNNGQQDDNNQILGNSFIHNDCIIANFKKGSRDKGSGL
jgi:hypothetical protein